MLNTKKLVFYIVVAAITLILNKGVNAQIFCTTFNLNFTGYDTICLLNLNRERAIDFNVNSDSGIYVEQDSAFFQYSSPTIVQHDDSVVIEDSKLTSKATFQWYDKYADSIPHADSSYFLPAKSGYYYVIITDSSGNESAPSNLVKFGLSDPATLNPTDDVQVSENNNLLNIKFINEPYYGYQLAIYNYTGQKVFSYDINSVNTIANLKPLVKGLYFASIEKGNKRIVKKIIIA